MKYTRIKLTAFTLAVTVLLTMVLTACGSESSMQINAPYPQVHLIPLFPQVLQTSTAEQLNYRKK